MCKVVNVSELTKTFDDKTVLNAVSFSVMQGEVFGLLGPSGAGKTTLLRILAGQLGATSGKSEVLGCESQKLGGKRFCGIGMLMDDHGLYERLSCFENLHIFAQIYGLSKQDVNTALEKVKLTDAKNTTVNKLSKGMKQRLSFARAILHTPSVLIFDEPTSGLDPATSTYIHDMIAEISANGAAIILTTHDMNEATKLCDDIVLISDGTIIEHGSPSDICLRHNDQGGYKILLSDGTKMNLPNNCSSVDTIIECFRESKIKSIHSLEVDLETVFIKLTGRSLE